MTGAQDPVQVCLGVIDNGLRVLRMDETASARVGVTGVHPCPGHPFAAQVWTQTHPGVFGLEVLTEVGPDPGVPGDVPRADLLVRYYPPIGGADFAVLTEDERALRRGEMFDDTGAPNVVLTRDLFGIPLFGVGLLRLAHDVTGQVVSIQAVSGTISGFRTVVGLLDVMVTMLAFVHRSRPVVVTPHAVPAVNGESPNGDGSGVFDAADMPAVRELGLRAVLPVNLRHACRQPTAEDDPAVERFTRLMVGIAKGERPADPLTRLAAAATPLRWWEARHWSTRSGGASYPGGTCPGAGR